MRHVTRDVAGKQRRKATNGRFSRNCSWKTRSVCCESIHRLIKVSIQTWLDCAFFFFLFPFARRSRRPRWRFNPSPQLLSQFLLVQDARIQREGREGVLLVNYSSRKLHFHPPPFGEGREAEHGWKIFPDFHLVRGYIRCLHCNFSRRINLWSPLRLWRDGPKTFNLCIGLSSLPSRWQERTRSQENARESLRDKFSHGSRNFEKFKLSHIHVESCLFVSSFIYKDL